jgi:hypothetical protein
MLCELCKVVEADSLHHLVPSDNSNPKVYLCDPCHDTIHRTFTNKQLKKSLYTIELLLGTPEIIKWLEWRVKHTNTGRLHVKMSNNRKSKGRYS